MATLNQVFAPRDADFLRSIGFVEQDTGDATVIVDTYGGDQQRVRPNDDGIYSSLQQLLDQAFAKDESGRLVHGTTGYVAEARNAGLIHSKSIDGIDWVRVDASPEHFYAAPGMAAVFDKVRPEYWGRYDDALGWMQPAAVAKAIAPITQKNNANWLNDNIAMIFGAIVTAGIALYAAPAIAAEGAAVGATTAETSAAVGSVIAPTAGDFSLVAAGSNVGIGGVGTAGVGLQVPATLGGTASGLGLSATGVSSTALLSAELVSAAGAYTFQGLTAAQAAEAATASGISAAAPASSSSWLDALTKPSTGSDWSKALTTTQKAVGTVGTLSSVASKLTGSSSSTGKAPATSSGPALTFNSSTTPAASGALLSPWLLLIAAGAVGLVILKRK